MNICFIGGGNMANAMIGGLLQRGFAPTQLGAVEIDAANRERLRAAHGINVFAQLEAAAIAHCDVVVLAVKPQQLREVATQLGSLLSAQQIVLSIAAGIRLADLARWLGGRGVPVRAMPNTPALVGAGMTGLYAAALDSQQRERVETIVRTAGAFVWVQSEAEMDAVTALSGSGPAYFFYFIEALEQAGKELGLTEAVARQLALETALGAAKLAHGSADDPATLRARVTSKNGTTERALLSMEAHQVKAHIIAAARAAADRAAELGDELGAD
ncbi:MAG: pyrroline-5-carboxylate reductase [Gallionellaceae bacterium]|jgi:pyrroline-5-carboxylate reductase|nr:pyrroline-5-carboxylate reductase [Gallionellaceae bacterium]